MTKVKEKIEIIKGSRIFTIDNNIVTYYDANGQNIKDLQFSTYE